MCSECNWPVDNQDEFKLVCALCGQVLIHTKGSGPSIKGNGLKISCRNCSDKLKNQKKLQ